MPLKALTWFQSVPLNWSSPAGSRCRLCFLGQRPPGTCAHGMLAQSHFPCNAVTWQRAVSLHRMSYQGKGNLGDAFGAAGSQDQVVTKGALGHDCHLDAVLSLHGRSPSFLTLFCCVPPRELSPFVPLPHAGTFPIIL